MKQNMVAKKKRCHPINAYAPNANTIYIPSERMVITLWSDYAQILYKKVLFLFAHLYACNVQDVPSQSQICIRFYALHHAFLFDLDSTDVKCLNACRMKHRNYCWVSSACCSWNRINCMKKNSPEQLKLNFFESHFDGELCCVLH